MNNQEIKFFHTNDGKAIVAVQDRNKIDSSASGSYATAVGYRAKASAENAIAFGKGAEANAENTIAVGTGNIVDAKNSGAFGDPNYIKGTTVDNQSVSDSYAFGNDNAINSSDTFVLGNNVNRKLGADGKPLPIPMNGVPEALGSTVVNSVYLGNQTTATIGNEVGTHNLKADGEKGTTTTAGDKGTVSSATVGGVTYDGFAGATANGVVSAGASGTERRIQNLAAVEISASSTDAINGSQLYVTNQVLSNAITQIGSNVDGALNKIAKRVDEMAGEASAGVSSAMAALPQAYIPGKSMIAGGVATYNGQGAVAVGMSKLSDNGRWVLKISGSSDSKGNAGASSGVG